MNILTSGRCLALGFILLTTGATSRAAESGATWLSPGASGVTVQNQPDGKAQIESTLNEFTVDSALSLPAKVGDAFAIEVRTKVGIEVAVHPELVCFDAAGREIPPPVAQPDLRQSTTRWQTQKKTLIAWPNTAKVRARLRGFGKGTVLTEALKFTPSELDTYQTGALVLRPHPRTRAGVQLESNFGIVNRERVSTDDRDGDGRWAEVIVNLDKITEPDEKGDDWRSNFEDNPNVILWTDGAVLKSDTIRQNRKPDAKQALHFRMQARPGPYAVRLSDPARPVAVSLDGKTWKRAEGGDEIDLGTLPMTDGIVEVWIDACYVDPIKAGPAYFDYVRLLPTNHAPDIERLFAAAKRMPEQIARGSVEERRVEVVAHPLQPQAGVEGRGAFVTWPVRCGLPIPQGELVSASNIAVRDRAGRVIPSQNRVTATWPDGSAKWIFLDFMHDSARNADARYTVTYGAKVSSQPPAAGVKIHRSADGLDVNTGALTFHVSGKRFGLLENVRLGSNEVVQREPITAQIVEAGGRVWNALEQPVTRLEIELAGPLHAVIVVETKLAESGKPSSGFYHRARIHAYAGSPLVHVDYFVANTDSRPAKNVGGSMASKVEVKSFKLQLRPAAKITSVRHDAGAGPASGARIQKTEDTMADERGSESAGRVGGWLALGLEGGKSLHVGVADFREQFPKALRWDATHATVDLWTGEGGVFEWIEGVGKTHQIALLYGTNPSTEGALLAAGPVLATAAPEWYVRSGALGDIITAAESGLPQVETMLAGHMKNPVVDRVGLGFENYGDHSSGGYVKGTFLWDNNEYDLPAGCMVHFARTGDLAALRVGLASAQHYLDVDTIHYSSKNAAWARAQHVHSHGTFGHHTAQGPDYHHAGYVQGLIWHSYLTGDPGGIEGARGIADWITRSQPVLTTGMERMVGHCLMTCTDVYEATGDEKYLRAAAMFVDQALKWEHPLRSGFLSRIHETPAFYSGSPFCNGVISAGLLKFNGWAKLPEVDAMLERFARWTLTDTWIAPAALASKGGSPRKGGSAQHIGNQGRLMAHVYEQTKDPLFLAVPAKLTLLGFGENAKPIPGTRSTGLVYNYLPWLLASLRENGDPTSEPQLEIQVSNASVTLGPAGKATVMLRFKNVGATAVEDLRASMHSRNDFTVRSLQSLPPRLAAGESAECRFEIQAPSMINLSCDYNSIAYAHCSVLYRRGGRAHYAHQTVKLVIKPPTVLALAKPE